MKIFAIKDKTNRNKKNLAYLFYYSDNKKFHIEIEKSADKWEIPFMLACFVEKGIYSINSYWSKKWVQDRIIPADRQNIGQILKNNNLKEYDEFKLLMLTNGKCEQDEYYLKLINESDLPEEIKERLNNKLLEAIPLNNNNILLFYKNGTVKKCNLNEYFIKNTKFSILKNRSDYFKNLKIQTGGYGIEWDNNLVISDIELENIGEILPLTVDEFRLIAIDQIINTKEATEILDCSRQYINVLVKSKKIIPIKSSEKNTVYLKSDIMNLLNT